MRAALDFLYLFFFFFFLFTFSCGVDFGVSFSLFLVGGLHLLCFPFPPSCFSYFSLSGIPGVHLYILMLQLLLAYFVLLVVSCYVKGGRDLTGVGGRVGLYYMTHTR